MRHPKKQSSKRSCLENARNVHRRKNMQKPVLNLLKRNKLIVHLLSFSARRKKRNPRISKNQLSKRPLKKLSPRLRRQRPKNPTLIRKNWKKMRFPKLQCLKKSNLRLKRRSKNLARRRLRKKRRKLRIIKMRKKLCLMISVM